MRRGFSNFVHTIRVDFCDGVCSSGVPIQKFTPRHFFWQYLLEFLFKNFWIDVCKVAIPGGILLRKNLQSHKRTRADQSVVRSAHRMAFAGIDSPETDSL